MAISKNNFDSIEEAIQLLSKGVVDVYFYKKSNGKVRRMHSTLDRLYIPKDKMGTLEGIISNAASLGSESRPFVVWDVTMAGWRSFYLSSTIEIIPSPIFGDTIMEVEKIVDEQTKDSESNIIDEAEQEMAAAVMSLMRSKIEQAIEDAPGKMVDFAESKLKQWASQILKNMIAGKSIKR